MQLFLWSISVCVTWRVCQGFEDYYFGEGDYRSDGEDEFFEVRNRNADDDSPLQEMGYSYIQQFKDQIKKSIDKMFIEKRDVARDGYKGTFTLRPITIRDVDIEYSDQRNSGSGFVFEFNIARITVVYDFDFFLQSLGDLKGSFSIFLDNSKILVYFKMGMDAKFQIQFKEDRVEFQHNKDDMQVLFEIDKSKDYDTKVADFGKGVINTFVYGTLGGLVTEIIGESVGNVTEPTMAPPRTTKRPPPPPPTTTTPDDKLPPWWPRLVDNSNNVKPVQRNSNPHNLVWWPDVSEAQQIT